MFELNKNSVSLAGEFAVLSQLTLRGFDANLTLGNTKSVDILASDSRTGKMFKLEVKTSYAGKPSHSKMFGHTLSWMMNKKHERISDPNLFYCFVNIEKETSLFRFFIVPSNVVANYVKKQHEYWLQNTDGLSQKDLNITMRNFRIGVDVDGYKIKTPLSKDYEDHWHF